MAIPLPLQEALKDSITSGTLVNTKFWVFSKRVGTKIGNVGRPKALFVNERVAKRVPRLGACMAHPLQSPGLKLIHPQCSTEGKQKKI